MTYNALDNIKAAESLIRQLQLEIRDIEATFQYDAATGFCSNCPRRWNADALEHVAERCCKDDPEYGAQEAADIARLQKICQLLREYIGSDAPEAAV